MRTRRNNYTDDDPCAKPRKSEGGGQNPSRMYIHTCINCISVLLRVVSRKIFGVHEIFVIVFEGISAKG